MIKIIVAYDIRENNRSNTIRKYLKTLGISVQNSLFELNIEYNDLAKVSQKLTDMMDLKTDKIVIYNLGNCDKIKAIRLPEINVIERFYMDGYIIV